MEKKLPKGWCKEKIEKIFLHKKGKKPKYLSEEIFEDAVPYLDIKAFEKGNIRRYADAKSSNLIDTDSIGIVWDGARSGWVGKGVKGAIGSTITRLTPIDMNLDYVFRFLQLKYKYINTNVRGVGIPHVDPTVFWNIEIPIPSLSEQERIVVKLDSLFSELEIVKDKMSRVPKLLKQFRQAVLTQAVTGELTENWRGGREFGNIEEDVEVYLKERLLLEHTPAKINSVNIIINEKDVDEFLIPSEWCFRNLNKLCTAFTYGSSSKSLDSGDVPVLRMGNLQNGEIDWSNLKYSSNETEISKYMLNSGDVLFNRTNSPELVGKTSVVRSTRKALYAGYLIKIWNGRLLNSYYLNFVLNSPYAKEWCWRVKSDGVSQSNINAQKLAHFSFPLPSIEEQKEIVKRVESLFKKADVIQKSYSNLKHQFEQLPQAILTKAFSGELVEQLPTDGDAKDLLKEIIKLKEELSQKKKPVKKAKSVKKKLSSSAANLEAKYPLYSILTNIIDGCSEEKLFSLSKMPQHKFLLQLDIELEKKVIIYKNDNILIVNPKYNEN